MKKEKTIEELEQDLKELRENNQWASTHYGSELCVGDMIRQEIELEDQIFDLNYRNGIIKRWEESGILDGLNNDFDDNISLVLGFDKAKMDVISSASTFIFNETKQPKVRLNQPFINEMKKNLK